MNGGVEGLGKIEPAALKFTYLHHNLTDALSLSCKRQTRAPSEVSREQSRPRRDPNDHTIPADHPFLKSFIPIEDLMPFILTEHSTPQKGWPPESESVSRTKKAKSPKSSRTQPASRGNMSTLDDSAADAPRAGAQTNILSGAVTNAVGSEESLYWSNENDDRFFESEQASAILEAFDASNDDSVPDGSFHAPTPSSAASEPDITCANCGSPTKPPLIKPAYTDRFTAATYRMRIRDGLGKGTPWGASASSTPPGKNKAYVVWVGRKTGVFTSWEETQKQIKNFPQARYRGFPTWAEADGAFHHAEDADALHRITDWNTGTWVVVRGLFPGVYLGKVKAAAAMGWGGDNLVESVRNWEEGVKFFEEARKDQRVRELEHDPYCIHPQRPIS